MLNRAPHQLHGQQVLTLEEWMNSREFVSTLSAPVLQRTIENQRQPKEHLRYEPTVVYHLAERAKARGVDLARASGPWQVRERLLARPGRNSLQTIPVVTNEHTEVMVDTVEHASDVAGLLNWCGVHELEPVPELNPPGE
jgi:hypothetical protein